MLTVCTPSMCNGCMACVSSCVKEAISFDDSISELNCYINEDKCINCGRCYKVCPNNNKVKTYSPLYIRQGWAEDKYRSISSSGGLASALMASFIQAGGYVCSCLFENGQFGFITTNDSSLINRFAGSKYVKSNPINAYQDIDALLKKGKKVLFVGLPCQSAAVQNYCDIKHLNNLYTIDLICHGTPSPKILKQYIEESGLLWHQIADIHFREKATYSLSTESVKLTPGQVIDSYTRAFLDSVDYTENCYECRYATFDRVSDITLGDAWGQMSETDPKGVSLILCQTSKGIELVQSADLQLKTVDITKAIEANHQLRHPARRHPGRTAFMKAIKKGRSVRFALLLALPKDRIKQSLKMGLIKMRIIRNGPK